MAKRCPTNDSDLAEQIGVGRIDLALGYSDRSLRISDRSPS